MRVPISLAAILMLGICAEAGADELKPKLYPTGFDCRSVPATDRATCEKTQIKPPKLEDPPLPPATGNAQPIYPGGKLPPAAVPPSPKLLLPAPPAGGN